MQGEERQYTIELKDGTQYRYLIDKKIPLSPIIAIEENTFFSLSGHDPEDSLFFRVVSTDHTEHVPFQRWSGKKEKIPFSDETLVAVEAYAVDQAGNTGILAASYVQKPRKGAESLSIINPVPGVFRNAQLFMSIPMVLSGYAIPSTTRILSSGGPRIRNRFLFEVEGL